MKEKQSLIRKLSNVRIKPDVTVLQGFFLDHFVTYLGDGGSLDSYISRLRELAELGGGNIPESRQQILRGGKGFNTSSALASLGARVHYLGRTDELGLHLMKFFARDKDIDFTHVKTDGELAMTVALELKHMGRSFNAMLNHPGSVADFCFEDLESSDLDLIRETDYLIVTEWTMNLRGTDLAEKIFSYAERFPCRKFFDPGDPSWRKQDINDLVERVLLPAKFQVLSVNESEAIWYASYFDHRYLDRMRSEPLEKLGFECAKRLRDELKLRIDLHTPTFTASIEGAKEFLTPTFEVEVRRVTGAGDAWQAGNVYGELIGLTPEERLLLANATAAYYISHPRGDHGNLNELREFIAVNRLRGPPEL
ncbi:carbohydrate kinase family protein [Candidatus Bathyarchaeota archaeon]|nr:carbohydrate kinase family protein [Candidatus Bathyarchaeota archaeon]